LDVLARAEKQTRLSADLAGNTQVLTHAVDLCAQQNNLEKLEEVALGYAKKRSIIKQAIASMVDRCFELPLDKQRTLQLIRTVSEGKVYS